MTRKIKEKIIKGVPASPGIRIGIPFYYVHENLAVTRETVPDKEIESEIRKYKNSLERTKEEVLNDKNRAVKRSGSDAAKVFDAHLLILDDEILIEEVISFLSMHNVQASYAVSKVMKDYQSVFEKIENEYFSQRAFDIEDVCRRIIKNILTENHKEHRSSVLKGKRMIVSNNIFPSDTLNFDKNTILGIVTEFGGKTSHAAILARSLGIPSVVGARGITKWINKTSLIIIDGYNGIVILNPTAVTFEKYKLLQHSDEKQMSEDLKYSTLPSVTLDGQKITVLSNIQSGIEADNVLKWHSDGVGLFRTEFLFKSSLEILSEDEQYKIYSDLAEKLYPKEIVIRLLDIGGDKFNGSLSVKEANPFLGVRGIRLLFKNPPILRSHIRAILRASAKGNISMLIPFVSNITEVKKIRGLVSKIKTELISEGIEINDKIKIGIMIEIPSIVMIADAVAKTVDYFSIGTNDLTQYMLAADRDNEKVNSEYDSFHPSVIKMIDLTVKAAHKAKIPVHICGQMAGYPIAIPLLIGLGLKELSVTPFLTSVVKKVVRRIDASDCRLLSKKCLKASNSRTVSSLLSDFFEKNIGDPRLR
ncbi:MAG: phosphoenolpyruvate--protein phosphotransferase [Candidatus Delongbacteria bacterium]